MTLADFRAALSGTDEIELGTVDRGSGREKTRPVWFVQHDDRLYFLPLTGSASRWYQSVIETPTIHLTAGDADYSSKAMPITAPTEVAKVLDDFRGKYGDRDVAESYSHPDVAVEARLH